MASGGGPKPRKSKDARKRAWRSLAPSVRKVYKKRGKTMGMSHEGTVQAYGSATRKSRIARGVNPNTGVRSARKRKVDKVAAKVTARAAASGKYAAPRSQKSARQQARKIIKGRKPTSQGTASYGTTGARAARHSQTRKIAAKVTARTGKTGKAARAAARKIRKGR